MRISKIVFSILIFVGSHSYAVKCVNEPNDIGGFKRSQCVTENRKESLNKACEDYGGSFTQADVGLAASNQVLCKDDTVIKVKATNLNQGLYEFDRVVGNLNELDEKNKNSDSSNKND